MNGNENLLDVLLVDDHTLFRESLRRLLEGEQGIQVIGEFGSAEKALTAIGNGLRFDVALIDYELNASQAGTMTGVGLLRELRATDAQARLLMVTAGMTDADSLQAVLELHAGVFLKSEPSSELLLAIEKTARGEQWISSAAALMLLQAQGPTRKHEARERGSLSPREVSVLRGVLEGLSNKEIAARLDLSESSVKAVLQKLFEKTGVRSRSQLVRYAIEQQPDLR